MNMQVARNTVVTLDYSVTDPAGELVDPGQDLLVYLHGGYDDIFPLIEEAVQGKRVGESVTVSMQPDDAFGEYDATLVQVEPRDKFPRDVQVGMQFEGVVDDEDDEDILVYRVTEITDDTVILDANHPLAGMALVFTCTVTNVRPATADEIRHGHIHDEFDDDDD